MISGELYLFLLSIKHCKLNNYNKMTDINKPVKLKNPEQGEEHIVYKLVNYNNETERCYIEPVNLDMDIPPQEIVSINDIENI